MAFAWFNRGIAEALAANNPTVKPKSAALITISSTVLCLKLTLVAQSAVTANLRRKSPPQAVL
jgi:hypothetical protein